MNALGKKITAWFLLNGRSLPWRNTRNPYEIWLAEIILQQTKIIQGLDYYNRFLIKFGCVHRLAAATETEVLKAWEGLGYYGRARSLHLAARHIAYDLSGNFPRTAQAWEQLPGVGPYTARAVASFAFGERVAVLDGNVFRVVARVLADNTPIDKPAARKHYQNLVDQWLESAPDSATFNHGIMDLGATVCLPRKPLCHLCPVAEDCKAFAGKNQTAFPLKAKKAKRPERFMDFWFRINPDGVFILERRDGPGVWKGLWVPPYSEVSNFDTPPANGHIVGFFIHEFTHYRLNVRVIRELVSEPEPPKPGQIWASPSLLETLPLPRAFWKMWEMLHQPAQASLFSD